MCFARGYDGGKASIREDNMGQSLNPNAAADQALELLHAALGILDVAGHSTPACYLSQVIDMLNEISPATEPEGPVHSQTLQWSPSWGELVERPNW
jgi:hypothetical protein